LEIFTFSIPVKLKFQSHFIFLNHMLTMRLTSHARVNQYTLVHQFYFLFLNYFFGVNIFFSFVWGLCVCFPPNSNLTYLTTYYILFWPYLRTNNQAPLLFTYLFTISSPNLFTPTHLLDFYPPNLHAHNLLKTPLHACLPTYLPQTSYLFACS